MATWAQMGFVNPLNPYFVELMILNNSLTMVMLFIVFFIFMFFLMCGLSHSIYNSVYTMPYLKQSSETSWTIYPGLFLCILGAFSIQMLYFYEELYESNLYFKFTGHQWYWESESGLYGQNLEIYMNENSLFNLMDVNNSIFMPYGLSLNMLVTSADVLHSFSVPSLGLKMDCVPGRLNSVKFESFMPGVAYGQCTEICGANHSFMPFTINFISLKDYFKMMKNF